MVDETSRVDHALISEEELRDGSGGLVIEWNGDEDSPDRISIPRRLDRRASPVRAKYLSFIRALGRHTVEGRTLIEHLRARDGYSLWWSSSLAEKSPFKSPVIVDCLKLLALEEILVERKPRSIRVRLRGRRADAVLELARALGIVATRESLAPERWTAKASFRRLPFPLQALIWIFRHQLPRLRFARMQRMQPFADPGAVTFFSYFFNMSEAGYREGRFQPAQWGSLPQVCAAQGVRMNFFHHFLPTPTVPDTRTAMRWVDAFNQNPRREGAHAFVDSQVGIAGLCRALFAFVRVALRSSSLGELRAAFTPPDSAANLWPLLRDDWRDSIRGRVALQACVWQEAFDRLLRTLPRQRLGLYLQENQGWERLLIHYWRRHAHGALIGVAHSTVRFWDLRYFDDPREYSGDAASARPMPDAVALNGRLAETMYEDAAYPGKIVPVEAVRFMYLARQPVRRLSRPPTLLVAGDSVREATQQMLACVASVPQSIRAQFRILFKPHPWCPVDLAGAGLTDMESRSEPIGKLIEEADLVCGGISSVTLEAYVAGAGVVVYVAPDSLNFSPIFGLTDVRMVRGPEDMGRALLEAGGSNSAMSRDVFHLDPAMPRWLALLKAHGVETGGASSP